MAHHTVRQVLADVILSAIPVAKIRPGTRRGESERVQTRGVVQVSPHRGLSAIEPLVDEVRDTCRGRHVVGIGPLHTITEIPPEAARTLRARSGQEREALAAGGVACVAALSGEFARAAQFMVNHIRAVEASLDLAVNARSPAGLRCCLSGA